MLFGICFSSKVAAATTVAAMLVAGYMLHHRKPTVTTTAPVVPPGMAMTAHSLALGSTSSAQPKQLLQLMAKSKMSHWTHEQEQLGAILVKSRESHVVVTQCR